MFNKRDDETRSAAIRAIKQMARGIFDAAEDDVIVVSELKCSEPGCPPLETVVVLLKAGAQPRQIKLHKAAVDVNEDDLRIALRTTTHDH